MTRMTTKQENSRAEVENALTSLSNASILLDVQVRLRIKQAMDRDPRMRSLLEPVIPLLDRTQHAIQLTKPILSELWEAGELHQWIGSSPLCATNRDGCSSNVSSLSSQNTACMGLGRGEWNK